MKPKEEVLQALGDCKVYVSRYSEAIQLKAFSLGYQWAHKGIDEVLISGSPFLYFEESTKKIDFGRNVDDFLDDPRPEVTPAQILGIKAVRRLDKEDERVRREVFQPFQHVLVRDHFGELWRPQIYGLGYFGGEHHMLDGSSWKYCIAYKDNEHLMNSTKAYRKRT